MLSRLEDENTGKMLLDELNITIPEYRVEETSKMIGILGEQVVEEFPWIDDMRPSTTDPLEGVLRRTWKPALSVVNAKGLPPVSNAGNVLRPFTSLKSLSEFLRWWTPPKQEKPSKGCSHKINPTAQKSA